jgi:hypothetical protein
MEESLVSAVPTVPVVPVVSKNTVGFGRIAILGYGTLLHAPIREVVIPARGIYKTRFLGHSPK